VNGTLNSVPIKPQIVRLYDIFVYGPLLLALGAGTVVYNLRNYLEIERRE
jgi:hypothetical protein